MSSPKPSRVERLERLSGTRTRRFAGGDQAFLMAVVAIIVIGSIIVGVARQGRILNHPTTADSWVNQIELYDCVSDSTIEAPTNPSGPTGLRIRSDGTLTIEPIDDSETGGNATLGRVFAAAGGSLGDSVFDVGTGTVLTEAGATCVGEAAVLQVLRWPDAAITISEPERHYEGLADLRLRDGDTIVIALAPETMTVEPSDGDDATGDDGADEPTTDEDPDE